MTDNGLQPIKHKRLSLSAQAQQYLLDLIEQGTYQPGEQLPSEADLATQLGISRPTLREALLNLDQDGFIIRRHGVGTFVAPSSGHRLNSGLECLESVLELAVRQGLQVAVDDLEVEQAPADEEIAARLQISEGTALTHVRRVIMVRKRPVAFMSDVVPSSVLSPADVNETFKGSVLDLLRQKEGSQIAQAVANIVAVNADQFLTRKLKTEPQQALLLLEETLFDDEGNSLGFSLNYFMPECFHFHVLRRSCR
jgi:GntR family transcriptional regulator